MSKQNALAQLAGYKRVIDDDIAAFAAHTRTHTAEHFGTYVLEAEVEVFLDILSRGGKRIRGALVLAGYEMCGGGAINGAVLQAARAIEMLHAYILMVDDIQDRSALRRGKPSAHQMLAAYHRTHKLKGDADHAGMSLALGAAVSGAHAAQVILATLAANPRRKLKVLEIVNRTMIVTAHGQTLDIMNELVPRPTEKDIEQVLEWKTARYTIINPLQVGMVLAGANSRTIDAITPFGLHIGKAFQIVDDILGIFGDQQALGKIPGDDIREGKGTLLVQYALQHSSPADNAFLQRCLGNAKLTSKEFLRCQHIIETSGAMAYAQKIATQQLDKALVALDQVKDIYNRQGIDFLKGMAHALHNRIA